MLAHIPHLEDLSRRKQHAVLTALLEGIREGTPRLPMTVKWDGLPAFVMGRDAQGFYVGPKGGQTKWRSVEDCEAHAYCGRAFASVWAAFENAPLESHQSIQGDVIFLDPLTNPVICRPNVTTYRIQLPCAPLTYRIGVAIHTINDQPAPDFWPVALATPAVWTAPVECRGVRPIDLHEATRLRTKALLGHPKAWQVLKQLLLDAYLPFWPDIAALEGHEGIVVWTVAGPVKIVNRHTFTKRNRRAWAV